MVRAIDALETVIAVDVKDGQPIWNLLMWNLLIDNVLRLTWSLDASGNLIVDAVLTYRGNSTTSKATYKKG